MPTYDYRCQNGHDSELFYRKFSEAPSELQCPVCGAEAVRRVSGGAGLVFKGSGFYLTDYGKNAHRKPSTDASKSDGKADGKAEGKSAAAKSESGASGAASDAGSGTSGGKSEGSKPSESKAAKGKSTDGQ